MSSDEVQGNDAMHYGWDVTGYPCFYVHGMCGDEKFNLERLNKLLELFTEALNKEQHQEGGDAQG